MKRYLLFFALAINALFVFAQPIKVTIVPNSQDWNYSPGDKVKFDVTVTMNSVPVKNAKVRYELSYDMQKPFKTEEKTLKEGKLVIDGGTMKHPGFLRCRVFAIHEGKEYETRCTAGFSPEKITPATKCPDDFVAFWDKAKADNAKIPIDAKLRLLPERCSSKSNVYEVSIQNYTHGGRIFGILCVPKAPGKYPALLKVPGAGVRGYGGDISAADRGIITLEIGVHGIPVTMDSKVYDNLSRAALNGYQFSNWDNRDKVYYKRIYMGCVRAVDYIFSMPEFDGKNIVVQGGSQGGALAIVTAGLDDRVTGLVSFYPALCDLVGYLEKDRAGGWPHLFRDLKDKPCVLEEKVKTAAYYDVVNFARQVKVPGFYSFGYNDMVCPPTSMFSAYNVVTAPTTLVVVPEVAHFGYPEQWNKASDWAVNILKTSNP